MKPLTIAVHNGTFHTDDVFACAVLALVYKERGVDIIRTRDEACITAAECAVDVGGVYDEAMLRFDHHQKGGAGVRENGIPYASFGLVWHRYGAQLSGSEVCAHRIDERLVQGIDAFDNGYDTESTQDAVHMYSCGEIISSLRPTWQENTSMDQLFLDAVALAKNVLIRCIAHAKAYTEATLHIQSAYENASDKRSIELEKEYPGWAETLQHYPEPLFVYYQRENGGWGAKAVPQTKHSFAVRKPFPEAWAGLRDEALQQITGVPDALFCHNGRFIVAAGSKDGIVRLVTQAIAH